MQTKKSEALVIAEWPNGLDSLVYKEIDDKVAVIQEAIRGIRDLRMKYNKPPSEKLEASIDAPKGLAEILNSNRELVCQLAGLKKFDTAEKIAKPKNAAAIISGQMQIYLHQAVDIEAERQRLEKQKQQLEQAKKGLEGKLANDNFIAQGQAGSCGADEGKIQGADRAVCGGREASVAA